MTHTPPFRVGSLIYAENSRLPDYDVTVRQETFNSSYHMIDFRNASRVKCGCIIHEEEKGKYNNYDELMRKVNNAKILELHPLTRESLRLKLAHYYRRIPDEDWPYVKDLLI